MWFDLFLNALFHYFEMVRSYIYYVAGGVFLDEFIVASLECFR